MNDALHLASLVVSATTLVVFPAAFFIVKALIAKGILKNNIGQLEREGRLRHEIFKAKKDIERLLERTKDL